MSYAVHYRWVKNNPKKIKTIYTRNRDKSKAFIDSFKKRPCVDCGGYYPPYVMDFDHVRGNKKFNLSHYFKGEKTKLINEMIKCQVICSNCHRIRTYNRRLKNVA